MLALVLSRVKGQGSCDRNGAWRSRAPQLDSCRGATQRAYGNGRPPAAVSRIQAIQDHYFKDLVDPGEQSVRVLRVAAVPGTENFLQVCFLQANPPPNQKNRNQQ